MLYGEYEVCLHCKQKALKLLNKCTFSTCSLYFLFLEVKVKNPWHRPLVIFLAAVITVGIITMVAISVVQNKPLHQKYKV